MMTWRNWTSCIGVLYLFGCQSLLAQVHVFTNKEGNKIEASIVSVEPDWSNMTISKGGKSFGYDPNLLILDDQQYVKDWLNDRSITAPIETGSSAAAGAIGAPAIEVKPEDLDVKFVRKLIDSDRNSYSSYLRLVTKRFAFQIEVNNRSRQTIPDPVIKYAVVWDDAVEFTSDTSYSHSNRGEMAIVGEYTLSNLIYNRQEQVVTDEVEINELSYDSGYDYDDDRDDDLVGIVVLVALADGTEIGEYRSSGAERRGLTYEQAANLNKKSTRSSREGSDGSLTLNFSKGESKDGPITLEDKRITISADITPDTQDPEGVIVAIGSTRKGVSMYIKDRKIVASVSNGDSIVWVSQSVPLGSFRAKMDLSGATLKLEVNEGTPGKRDDVKPLIGKTREGIQVGSDSESSAGDYPEGFSFAGDIENALILVR